MDGLIVLPQLFSKYPSPRSGQATRANERGKLSARRSSFIDQLCARRRRQLSRCPPTEQSNEIEDASPLQINNLKAWTINIYSHLAHGVSDP